jgi:hypothetical protein
MYTGAPLDDLQVELMSVLSLLSGQIPMAENPMVLV